jgi:ribosome maturation factor RimP
MHPSELRGEIRRLVESTIERMGFELVAVEWTSNGRRPLLRLSIDAPGGVGADDCAAVSHRINPVLDAADPISSAYALEVSSPGIDRAVQRLKDFERFTGYRCRIKLEEGLPRRRYTGTLRGVDGEDVRIEVDGEEHVLAFASIDAANLVLTLEEYERLGQADAATRDASDGGNDDHE